MTITCMEYMELVEEIKKSGVKEMLDSFSVQKNNDVDKFIHHEFTKYEKSHNARSYFMLSEKAEPVAFFTLSIHSLILADLVDELEDKLVKKIRGYGRKNARSVPCYLIGQLARNDSFSHEELSGTEILKTVFGIINEGKRMFGGRFVAIDCEDALINFYERNGFQKINKKEKLNTMIAFIQ